MFIGQTKMDIFYCQEVDLRFLDMAVLFKHI